MEISSFRSLAELGMDDPLYFHQWPMSSFEELSSVSASSGFYENLYHSNGQQSGQVDFKRTAEPSQTDTRPLKQFKTANWNSCKIDSMSNSLPSNTFHVLNSDFAGQVGSVKPEEETWSYSSTLNFPSESIVSGKSPHANQNFMIKPFQEAKRVTMNTRLAQSQDHILAERKRREKLSQRFIALSTLIPGLKKMDKASVLGDAIKYMKQLQDKVNVLEEQNKKRTMESVVFVKKHNCYADVENYTSNSAITTEALPELEARFCNNDVLISIHCEKRKGMLEKTVAEIEKLHLSVVNSSVMSFGDSALNITVIAEKDEEFNMNIKEVVKQLRGAIGMFL